MDALPILGKYDNLLCLSKWQASQVSLLDLEINGNCWYKCQIFEVEIVVVVMELFTKTGVSLLMSIWYKPSEKSNCVRQSSNQFRNRNKIEIKKNVG